MKVDSEYKYKLKKKYRFSCNMWESTSGCLYIGYNHKVTSKQEILKYRNTTMSRHIANKIFERDIMTIEKFLKRNLNRHISQKDFDIMVSLCYDRGTRAIKNSLFFSYYLIGNTEEAFKHYMQLSKHCGEQQFNFKRRRLEELEYVGRRGFSKGI